MIRNLNQMTFQGFGTVPTERSQSVACSDRSAAAVWELAVQKGNVFRAKTDTWVTFGTGTSVLSVSRDGERFQHYYLDKTVCICEGVFFALSAFRGKATARLSAETSPEQTEVAFDRSVFSDHTARVETICTFCYSEKEQGFLFSGESHPMAELIYVDQGALHCVVNGRDLLLREGDLAICGPDQWHMQYADIGMAPRYVTISFVISGVDLTPLLNRRFAASHNAVEMLQSMLREQEQMDDYSDEIILAQLKLLLLRLLRETVSSGNEKRPEPNAVRTENEIICRAQQYIASHVREKLSVPLVARQVDVSPSYLTALFHKNLRISPGEYIRRIKLQESKQMIRENDLNFTEIAAELQYSTVHHFSRQFKEKFGITPTEYAKSVR